MFASGIPSLRMAARMAACFRLFSWSGNEDRRKLRGLPLLGLAGTGERQAHCYGAKRHGQQPHRPHSSQRTAYSPLGSHSARVHRLSRPVGQCRGTKSYPRSARWVITVRGSVYGVILSVYAPELRQYRSLTLITPSEVIRGRTIFKTRETAFVSASLHLPPSPPAFHCCAEAAPRQFGALLY